MGRCSGNQRRSVCEDVMEITSPIYAISCIHTQTLMKPATSKKKHNIHNKQQPMI